MVMPEFSALSPGVQRSMDRLMSVSGASRLNTFIGRPCAGSQLDSALRGLQLAVESDPVEMAQSGRS